MTRAKAKTSTETVAAETLEAGDVIVLPNGGTWTVIRVQLGVNVVRVTSEAGRPGEPNPGRSRPFNVLRTTQFVRQTRA